METPEVTSAEGQTPSNQSPETQASPEPQPQNQGSTQSDGLYEGPTILSVGAEASQSDQPQEEEAPDLGETPSQDDPGSEESFAEEANPGEQPIGETPATPALQAEYDALKLERDSLKAQLEAKPNLSQQLLDKVTSDDFYQEVSQIQAMPLFEVMLKKVEQEPAYLGQPRDVLIEVLQERFPDIDPEIPSNLGLPTASYLRLKHEADGFRASLLKDAKENMVKTLSEFGTQAPQGEPEPFDKEKYFQSVVNPYVENELASFKMPEMPKIEGVELKGITQEQLREKAMSNSEAFTVDEKGNLVPDLGANAKILLFESLISQLGPMVTNARREAPPAARQAIQASLNNAPPPSKSSQTVNPSGMGQRRSEGVYEPRGLVSVTS